MNISNISGSAYIAFLNGMKTLRSMDRVALSAGTGTISGMNAFATLFREGINETSDSMQVSQAEQKTQSEAYMDHLKEKYGVVRVESIGKDQHSLDHAGATMSGTDVVIAPNMLEKMASDPKIANRIEGTIDYFFNNIPKYEQEAAAMGLKFESCGCVVHEDGTVTYICGCADSPERVAEVDRINKEKREKEAAKRKESLELSLQATLKRKQLYEDSLKKKKIQEITTEHEMQTLVSENGNIHFIDQSVIVNTGSIPF